MNYELKLCIGVFFLSIVLIFKINFLWVVFLGCVCIVNQAHLNPGLYFSSSDVLICSLARTKLRGRFQKTLISSFMCVV